jgi:hypothetical protein
MRSLIGLVGLVLIMLVVAVPTGAQEAPPSSEPATDAIDCVAPEYLSNALVECESALAPSLETASPEAVETELEASISTAAGVSSAEAIGYPAYCRLEVDAVFWSASQWLQLAQALGSDRSPCAEYYVSIPPQDGNDVKELRPTARYAEVRAVNSHIHPVAEIRYTAPNRLDWRELAISLGGDLATSSPPESRRVGAWRWGRRHGSTSLLVRPGR